MNHKQMIPPNMNTPTKATRCIKRRSRTLEPRAPLAPTGWVPKLIGLECIQSLVFWCLKPIRTTTQESEYILVCTDQVTFE